MIASPFTANVGPWEQLPAPHLARDPLGNARSSHWPIVAHAHLKLHPCCDVCGTRDDCEVHHVEPFHLHPEKELDPANLMTLCRPHHLLFGHFMAWVSFNTHVRADAAEWKEKIQRRPTRAA